MLIMGIQAYDSHCNLVLGEVEETIYAVDDDEEDSDEVKVWQASIAYRRYDSNSIQDN